jgi:outer membrane cobalamin receptor
MTAVSSTLFVGSSVRAQETNKSDLLEEIVVTAERRQTPLQTTPKLCRRRKCVALKI